MKWLLLFCFALTSASVLADEETRAAVKEVQKQMRDPKFRDEKNYESKESKAVVKKVKDIAGSEANEQEIYNLAADVLGNMQDLTPEQMNQLLQEAQKNPEAFANRMTPEQKRKLKELAEKLPASQKRNP